MMMEKIRPVTKAEKVRNNGFIQISILPARCMAMPVVIDVVIKSEERDEKRTQKK